MADQWLADPHRSITDIGLELGYSDAANFSRAFRAARGRTPNEARAELLGTTPRAPT
ncbi:MAG: helix-turn-helix domain-containing protein [Sandaracinaceae bacterium]|nr:helix-turn-helix domain-containing protein [Sandaracinaceae bacterium]